MTLFLSGDLDELHREVSNVAFMSAAIDVMTEAQIKQAQVITGKRIHAMMKEISDAAKDHVQNAERGGTH